MTSAVGFSVRVDSPAGMLCRLRFTSGVTPADVLAATMAAVPLYTRASQEFQLVTDRIRSMGEGYAFTSICLSTGVCGIDGVWYRGRGVV